MIKIKYLTIFLFFPTFIFNSFSQQNERDYSDIDLSIEVIPDSLKQDVKMLALQLDNNNYDDYQKFRAAFIWISKNISYDFEKASKTGPAEYLSMDSKDTTLIAFSLESGTNLKIDGEILGNNFIESSNRTLKKGKGVCDDYSQLLKTMLTIMGVECKIICGYAKGIGYKMGSKIKKPNHSWNFVKLEEKWYITDVTWAAASEKSDDIDLFYFLPKSEFLKTSHYPENVKKYEETGLTCMKSLQQFEDCAKIYSQFYKSGFKEQYYKGFITTYTGVIELTINPKKEHEFEVHSLQNGKSKQCEYKIIEKTNNSSTISIRPYFKGKQTITIYVFGKNGIILNKIMKFVVLKK